MKKKIKIIDLLCLISVGEELPKKIKYDGQEYKITKILLEDNNYYFNYINEDIECIFPINTNHLNDEVEILDEEDKDIPLIPDDELYELQEENIMLTDEYRIDYNFKVLKEKINQVVEEFNEYRKGNE